MKARGRGKVHPSQEMCPRSAEEQRFSAAIENREEKPFLTARRLARSEAERVKISALMGIPLKITTRRTARGKTRKLVTDAVPGPPFLFDIAYNRELHHRVALNEIRMLVKRKGSRYDLRKARIAKPWHDAILRDAPMLKGFFSDEPKWRDRILRWCEAVLAEN